MGCTMNVQDIKVYNTKIIPHYTQTHMFHYSIHYIHILHIADLFAKACGAKTDGPNKALPIATEPLRYLRSEPGAAEYRRLPTPNTHTDRHTQNDLERQTDTYTQTNTRQMDYAMVIARL